MCCQSAAIGKEVALGGGIYDDGLYLDNLFKIVIDRLRLLGYVLENL